ncbi:MAG: GerW family sporulation protein [Clostridium sp.]|nr:GerW family sporulation protein [Clostridium sp.]
MENKSRSKENMEALFNKLENFLTTETVVGKPIEVGETTLVPIISVTFGCGTGAGFGRDKDKKSETGEGDGLGAAAKITPDAIVVIKGESVNVLPIKGRSNMDNLLSLVPDILSKIKKPSKTKDKDKD